MNLDSSNLSISFRMTFCLSGWKRLIFCWTGLTVEKTLSLWDAIEGWIPFISECAHAKMSWFRLRVFCMLWVSSGVMRELMFVRWVLSSEIWIVCKGSTVGRSFSAGPNNCYWSHVWLGLGGVHPPSWFLLLVLSGSIGERLTGCHKDQSVLRRWGNSPFDDI